jgi:quinol monooxygenase YgiN
MAETSRFEIFIFARLHAREGAEEGVASALREVVGPTRGEAGCLSIGAYRSMRDPGLFYIHSRWREAAFERHAAMAHTVRFIEMVERLVDQPLEVVGTRTLDGPAIGAANLGSRRECRHGPSVLPYRLRGPEG